MPNLPLPEPYADGTPQDHADALRDHADPRIGGPMLDYFALVGAALIERQQAQILGLLMKLKEATDSRPDYRQHAGVGLPCEPCAGPCRIDSLGGAR